MDWGGRSRGSGSPWSTILTTPRYGTVLPSGNKVQSVAPRIGVVVVAALVLRGVGVGVVRMGVGVLNVPPLAHLPRVRHCCGTHVWYSR